MISKLIQFKKEYQNQNHSCLTARSQTSIFFVFQDFDVCYNCQEQPLYIELFWLLTESQAPSSHSFKFQFAHWASQDQGYQNVVKLHIRIHNQGFPFRFSILSPPVREERTQKSWDLGNANRMAILYIIPTNYIKIQFKLIFKLTS